jgi:TMEM175 potassium channel family protein
MDLLRVAPRRLCRALSHLRPSAVASSPLPCRQSPEVAAGLEPHSSADRRGGSRQALLRNGHHAAMPRSLSSSRMEAFSDGVFAIAATLLVLDIALPVHGTALERALNAWPAYLGYVVSFLTIGAAWLTHSALTDRLTRADPILLRINLVLLLVVAFLPFPTNLVAEALHDVSGERVFVTMYGLTLLAIRTLLFALDEYASREHLYARDTETEESRIEERKLLSVLIGYVVAILIGLALPRLAVVFYFGIAIYLIVPFREVARLLFRRS